MVSALLNLASNQKTRIEMDQEMKQRLSRESKYLILPVVTVLAVALHGGHNRLTCSAACKDCGVPYKSHLTDQSGTGRKLPACQIENILLDD